MGLLQVVLLQFGAGGLGEKLRVGEVLEALEEVDVGATAAPEAGDVGAGVEGSGVSTQVAPTQSQYQEKLQTRQFLS